MSKTAYWQKAPATVKLIDPWGRSGYVAVKVYGFLAEDVARTKAHDVAQFFAGARDSASVSLPEDVGDGVIGFRVEVNYSLPVMLNVMGTGMPIPGPDITEIFFVMWRYDTDSSLKLTLGQPSKKLDFSSTRLAYEAICSSGTGPTPGPFVSLQLSITGPSITTSQAATSTSASVIIVTVTGTVETTQESPSINTLDTIPLRLDLHLPRAATYTPTRLYQQIVHFATAQGTPPVKEQQSFDAWLRGIKEDKDLGDWVKNGDLPFVVEGRASEAGTYQENVKYAGQRKDWAVKRITEFVSSDAKTAASAIGVPPGAKKGANQEDQVAIVTLDSKKLYQLMKASKPERW